MPRSQVQANPTLAAEDRPSRVATSFSRASFIPAPVCYCYQAGRYSRRLENRTTASVES